MGADIDVDIYIDSEMAAAVNWGSFKWYSDIEA